MIALPFPSGRGQHWSARLGHVAGAIARETGMTVLLPGVVVPAVSAATPPRPDGGKPPQAPTRTKAALTLFGDQAVFAVPAKDGVLHLRCSRNERRILVGGPQDVCG